MISLISLSKFSILTLFILNCLNSIRANEVIGCGGFLKSHVPIDFSKVEVKLVTKQGIVKDKTSAAPNNGYYFVPLYDKGEMRLELSPPPGWSFEPNVVSLVIDGSDPCSQGKDINFRFKGFGITGQVFSLGNNKGPGGVKVKLDSKEGTRTTNTDAEGVFFFTPVFPGKYSLSISHQKWKILKGSLEVTVTEGNTELPKNSFVVQGYHVSGIIRSEKQAVKDAAILLYSDEGKKDVLVDGCNKDTLSDSNLKKKPLCYTTSNEDGKFMFGTVPNGKYYTIPYYKGQNIYFEPEKIEFSVAHNSIELGQHFQIVGFSVTGRVLKSQGIPLANANIFVNDKEITKTDLNGVYKLDRIKAGTYRIKAEYDDFQFEEISYVSPTLQIPDIFPSAFKVCGTVTSDHSQVVTFTKQDSTVSVDTEKKGNFCLYLAPGVYDAQVVVNEEDTQKGLQFFPLVQKVQVASEKISNVIFSQLKLTVTGEVKCMQPAVCEGLAVILKGSDGNEVTLKVKGGLYSVSDVYPGIYHVTLITNKYCWEQEKQIVNVNSASAVVPPFVQKGYTVNFLSSHESEVHFKVPGETKTTVFAATKGKSSFCLPKPGGYKFNLISCHKFDTEFVMYRTSSETNEIALSAQKHKQKLSVLAEVDFGSLQISVKIGTEKVDRTLKHKNGYYELDILLEPGETAVVVPHSDTLFFTPPILSVEGEQDCNDLGTKFVAVKGKLFRGKVIPPLPGVVITVESSESEQLVVETDGSGVFKFPPLDNKKEYKIQARKDSYVLTGPDNNGNFLAHKLAEVVIEVLDYSNNKPLSGVLLSLSGGESYRKNLQSNEDGKISFGSLSPSEYFLRPMMKEYMFEPNSKIIPVTEGQTVIVRLVGKRIAYSAFGQVVSLNGEAEDNTVVLATGFGNCSHFSEETSCDSSGQFRIRGLQPYCSYNVVVKESLNSNVIDRSAPESIKIENITQDVEGLKLVVFRPASQMDILVRVYSPNIEHYKQLRVRLIREESSSVIHTAKLDSSLKLSESFNPGILVQMPSVPIDNSLLTIQLESSVMQNGKLQSDHIVANTSFLFAELGFNLKSNNSDQPIKRTSNWGLVFIFGALFAAYNIEFIANIVRDRFNFSINSLTNFIPVPNTGQKSVAEYYDDAQIDQIVQNINNAKRKPKPKKA